MVFHEFLMAHGGPHQDVSPASPFDEEPGDVLPVFGHELGRGRFMVNIGGIDGCTPLQQQSRDLDSAGKVQRSLAIAASGVNEAGVAVEEFEELSLPSQARGGMSVEACASRDGVGGQLGGG